MLSRRVIASPQRRRSVSHGETSDENSSGNEYAEGLGCADRKACRARRSSNFEFDNHPREEYFEQPESLAESLSDDSRSDDEYCLQLSACFQQNTASGNSLLSALAELEQNEDASRRESDREQFVRQKMAAISRRADRRLAKRDREASCAEPAREAKAARKHKAAPTSSNPAATSSVSEAPPIDRSATAVEDLTKRSVKELLAMAKDQRVDVIGCVEKADIVERLQKMALHKKKPASSVKMVSNKMLPTEGVLKKYCKELVAIRGRMDAAGSTEVEDRSRTVDILRALESVRMDAALLKLSGLGLELNRNAWNRHPLSELATRSTALVRKWRTSYHLQRQRKRDAGLQLGAGELKSAQSTRMG